MGGAVPCIFDTPTTIGPVAQLLHAAIDLGIGRGAFAATLEFVREHARPWVDAGVERAADDPLAIQQVGDVAVRLRAAEALLHRAGRIVDATQRGPDADSVANASVAVAEARALTTTASLLAGSKLFELVAPVPRWTIAGWTVSGATRAPIPCMIRCAGNTTRWGTST